MPAAYQNCNYTPLSAFYSAVNECQHYLRVIETQVNSVGFHTALLCDVNWDTVGEWERLRLELEAIVHRLGGIETPDEKET